MCVLTDHRAFINLCCLLRRLEKKSLRLSLHISYPLNFCYFSRWGALRPARRQLTRRRDQEPSTRRATETPHSVSPSLKTICTFSVTKSKKVLNVSVCHRTCRTEMVTCTYWKLGCMGVEFIFTYEPAQSPCFSNMFFQSASIISHWNENGPYLGMVIFKFRRHHNTIP